MSVGWWNPPNAGGVAILKGLRVSVRLNAYAYLLTDEYPPFSTD